MRRLYCTLKALMMERDPEMSQAEVCRATGISPTTMSKLVRPGPMRVRVDPEIVERLAEYFGCELTDLFELRED